MAKRILVVFGQPERKSYGGALAVAYIEGARASGAEVREIYLGELRFNPAPLPGQSKPGEIEPDLAQAQASIKWAEHLVFVYPIWWGTIPALLKGFIERVFTPGFAVNYRNDSWRWDKLLVGRSARLIVTLNTPSFVYRWLFGRPGHITMKRTILGYCGVKPIRITEVGPIKGSTDAKRARWLEDVRGLGRRGG
jgi:NAD(P)H dehydrogenase (quinone)